MTEPAAALFPLTDLQEAYWLGESTGLPIAGIVARAIYELAIDDLDVARFQHALDAVVAHHAMLRAVVDDGGQRVLAQVAPLAIELEDLRGAGAAAAEARLRALREELAARPGSAERWPPLTAVACRLDGGVSHVFVSRSIIFCDLASFHVLLGDLQRAYLQPGVALPPVGRSFQDHVLALAARRASAAGERALDYWKRRLDHLPPAPALPLCQPPGAIRTARFARRSAELAPAAWEALQARAAHAHLSPAVVLCAAFAEALRRWSKEPRFTLNFLGTSRSDPALERTIGQYGSTVLLEVDTEREPSFQARARRLQAQLLRDVAHGLVSGVEVTRQAARTHGWPLQAMPIVFASSLGKLPVPWRLVSKSVHTPHVFLDHHVREQHGALVLHVESIDELFPPGLLDDFFAAYAAHVRALAEDDAAWRAPSRASVPAPPAHLEARARVNATAGPIEDATLHALVLRAAARTPDAVAVISAERRLSYRALLAEAWRLARRLRAAGARPNTLVGVAIEKSCHQLVAVLGVMLSGAAYLPIDPRHPAERRAIVLARSGAALVVTGGVGAGAGAGAGDAAWPAGVRCLALDAAGEPEPAAPDEPDEDRAGPADLAYVLYTSGSTGEPKGVAIEHRGAVNTILDINARFGVGAADRALALSDLGFDLSVYDVFGLLAAGGAVVVPEPASGRDPARWAELIAHEAVTIWSSVPALAQMLVDDQAERGARLDGLRLALLSGDWIPVSLPDQLKELARGIEVISLGGATEASIWSILYPIDRTDPAWRSVPYGRPMRNQVFHVLDRELAPCPIWVPGELYIGGLGVAREYWRDPERTAASFLVHPVTGERLYRTGDWGRYLPDGNIEFLGREDGQVKIRGFRIELGEIEAALRRHPDVHEAVAIVRQAGAATGAPAGAATGEATAVMRADAVRHIVGYVVPKAERRPAPEALLEHLRHQLPEYMLPTSIAVLSELPLTPTGKVDRHRLPGPAAEGPAADIGIGTGTAGGAPEPLAPIERQIAALWQELLGHGPVRATDNFFELGGNSLLALRMSARIERQLGVRVPLAILLAHPTVRRLAAALAREAPRAWSHVVPIAGGAGAPLFLVHPSGGNVLCYRGLAHELGDALPLYGLRARGVDAPDDAIDLAGPAGVEPRLDTVPRLAAAYLRAIIEAHPDGPYRLGGWSFGGLVAYELARQLRESGRRIDGLILIDSWPPTARERALAEADAESPDASPHDPPLELLLELARDLAWATPDAVPTAEDLAGVAPDRLAGRVLATLEARGALPPGLEAAGLRRLSRVFAAHRRAAARYQPEPYDGRTLLVRAATVRPDFADAAARDALGWAALIPRTALHDRVLPGDHYSLVLTPHVRAVAAEVASFLGARTGRRPARMDLPEHLPEHQPEPEARPEEEHQP